ncbi:MAG: ferritin-like domain-containing protein [Caldilineaceae bacterium]
MSYPKDRAMCVATLISGGIEAVFSRRRFLGGTLAGGAFALVMREGSGYAFAQGLGDADILQFALTLEQLTTAMYRQVLATTVLTEKDRSYLTTFADHEAAHVDALATTLRQLGAEPVQPQATYNFPAFDTRENALEFAGTVESIAIGAYQGAAAAIRSPEILAAAGSIVQSEARHAAIINFLLGQPPAPRPTTASLTVEEVNAQIGPILEED